MYYVYVLHSAASDRFYVGSTDDLRVRLQTHNRGAVSSTMAYRPWELWYYEAHRTHALALAAERFYKTSVGRRHIKKKLGMVRRGVRVV
ncbi:GIY-YIG nuclease family protein, partial [Candidatus Uhrbacteria bacterium]|nr:GIY-YIG nuclease family protein [Candidatus Uhrbacteria bacterium]